MDRYRRKWSVVRPQVFRWLFVASILTVLISLSGYNKLISQQHVKKIDFYKTSNLFPESVNTTFVSLLQDSMTKYIMYSGSGTKYLVYECTAARGDECSGWSDRIAGIMTTFIISILSKRKFLINFDTPYLLQDYVMPAHYDWRYYSSILLNRTSSYHNFKSAKHRIIAKYMFDGVDFNTFFKDDVIFLLMNWDFITEFRKRPNIKDDIPWIKAYHQVDIYKSVYNFLFKISPLTVQAWRIFDQTQRKRNKIACAHVRYGNNPNMPKDVSRSHMPLDVLWAYFDNLDMDEYDLFVASDTDSVKDTAKERYPENIIDTPGKITHIDRPHKNDPTEGFLKQLQDFYILMDCDILIVPEGTGFSMLAAFIRNKNYGLYCWKARAIMPCSRYKMTNVVAGGKFDVTKLLGRFKSNKSTRLEPAKGKGRRSRSRN